MPVSKEDMKKKMRFASSDPSLQDKITVDIDEALERVYWYIKFNIPLDGSTVSYHTMTVKDTDGYIMRTAITYADEKNMIVVSPMDSYQQGRFYILTISQDVKSAGGNNLKSVVNILFKLKNNVISEFKMVPPHVELPEPRPRPQNYDELQRLMGNTLLRDIHDDNIPEGFLGSDEVADTNIDDSEKDVKKKRSFFNKDSYQDNLPFADLKVNILLGVIGVGLTIASILVDNRPYIIASMCLCTVGVLHIIYQLNTKKIKSVLKYNLGVIKYNKGNYEKALKNFERAVDLQEENTLAMHAANKSREYL